MKQPKDRRAEQRGDRRSRTKLRDYFDTAYVMLEPFFQQATGWGGRPLQHLALHFLHSNFPQLSPQERHDVIIAAHRVYIDNNPEGSDHLHRPEEVRRGR